MRLAIGMMVALFAFQSGCSEEHDRRTKIIASYCNSAHFGRRLVESRLLSIRGSLKSPLTDKVYECAHVAREFDWINGYLAGLHNADVLFYTTIGDGTFVGWSTHAQLAAINAFWTCTHNGIAELATPLASSEAQIKEAFDRQTKSCQELGWKSPTSPGHDEKKPAVRL